MELRRRRSACASRWVRRRTIAGRWLRTRRSPSWASDPKAGLRIVRGSRIRFKVVWRAQSSCANTEKLPASPSSQMTAKDASPLRCVLIGSQDPDGAHLCSFNDLNGNEPSRAANPDEGGSVLLAWW